MAFSTLAGLQMKLQKGHADEDVLVHNLSLVVLADLATVSPAAAAQAQVWVNLVRCKIDDYELMMNPDH